MSARAVPHRLRAAAAALALLLAACTSPPRDVTEAPVAVPRDWGDAMAEDAVAGATVIDADWWRSFGSPQLDDFVAAARAGNADLRIAAERVRQADIALHGSRADALPEVGVTLGVARDFSKGPGEPGTSEPSTSARLSIAYEVDLWGRVAALARSAEAGVDVRRRDLDAAHLSLAAQVAATWFDWLGTRARRDLARDNLAVAERVLRVVEARYRNGVATSLDVAQQTSTVLAQRSALVPLELQQRQTRTALALLLGRVPQDFAPRDEPLDALQVPRLVPVLPAALLARRPDLASAEAQLAAADADIAAARAALWPSLSLSAGAGLGTASTLSLAHPALAASVAASLAQTLFDGGRRTDAVSLAQSQRRVLVETYAASVRTAFKEVDDALANAERAQRQEQIQQAIIDSAQRALRLAELRYREGAADLLAVLDAQRSLFNAQDLRAQLRVARLNAAVDLYKALGGGWRKDAVQAPRVRM